MENRRVLKTVVLASMFAAMLCVGCGKDSSSIVDVERPKTAQVSSENEVTKSEDSASVEQSVADEEAEEKTADSLAPEEGTVENSSGENDGYEEYVNNYSAVAIKGVEIIDVDAETGVVEYVNKCEYCGWTSGKITSSATHGSFNCGDTSCTMWGKPQEFEIEKTNNGEWVWVQDGEDDE